MPARAVVLVVVLAWIGLSGGTVRAANASPSAASRVRQRAGHSRSFPALGAARPAFTGRPSWRAGLTPVAEQDDGAFVVPLPEEFRDAFQFGDVAMLPDGSVLIASGFVNGDSVVRAFPDGSIVPVPGFTATGLAVGPDGTVFAVDASSDVVRRWSLSAAATVLAGTGAAGFRGDGGPALSARLNLERSFLPATSGVAPVADGSVLFADSLNGRVRSVDAAGTIRTVAGNGRAARPRQDPDGRLAREVAFGEPMGVTGTPDGGFVVSDRGTGRLSRVTPGGVVETLARDIDQAGDVALVNGDSVVVSGFEGLWQVPLAGGRVSRYLQSTPTLLRDFAARSAQTTAIGSDGHGGLLAGSTRGLLLVPGAPTPWTLVALRGTRIDDAGIDAEFETTQPGTATVEIERGTRVLAQASAHVSAGAAAIRVPRPLGAGWYRVRVTLRGDTGRVAQDAVAVLGAPNITVTLARRLLGSFQGGEETVLISLGKRCRRYGRRRVDCEIRSSDGGYVPPRVSCDSMASLEFRPSGIVLRRDYACGDRHRGLFRRHPRWITADGVRALGPGDGGRPN